ncbi:MAG: PAS domain S-box protein [Desulfovibrionaceae bacterium]
MTPPETAPRTAAPSPRHGRIGVWAAVGLSVLVCAAIAWLHLAHQRLIFQAAQRLETLSQARIDLAKGFLAVTLSDQPDSPFQRDQGLALLDQALAALNRADDGLDEGQDLRRRIAAFQDRLGGGKDAEAETALRIAFHDLERRADAVDARARDALHELAARNDRQFARALATAVVLLAAMGSLVFWAVRARERSDAVRRRLAARHETILRSMGHGVVVADAEGRVELVNPAAEAMTGLDADAARGRPLEAVARCVDERTGRPLSLRPNGDGPRPVLNALLTGREGDALPVAGTLAPILDEGNRIAGTVLTLRDQSAERRFRRALSDSEQHYRTLANSGSALIWTSGTDTRCDYFNEPWLRFTGRTLKQDLGDGWTQNVHPDDLERCLEIYTTAFERRADFVVEYRLRHADGGFRWVMSEGRPRYDASGAFLGYIGFCLDITASKTAELALRESEERFRTLADSAPEGIVIQMDCRFAYVNRTAAEMLGASGPEALLGLSVPDRVHPDDREQVRQRIRMVNEERRAAPPAELVFLRQDGSPVELELAAVPFALSGRHGALVFLHPIGERKRAEAALRQAMEAAKAASRAKSEFLANMSHEIRTPLNGIMGMLQLLEAPESEEERKTYLDIALQASRRLTRLLSDILDLSMIEARRLTVECAEFDLDAVRESILDLLGGGARATGATLRFDLGDDVPRRLLGDQTRLQQVLFNLAGNAVKFAPGGEVRITAQRLPRTTPGADLRLLFTVSDTGIGIPEDLQARIFDPFVQAEASFTRRYQGAGLGLSIVRRLVELMGGEAALDSTPGQGTAFYVTLPFRRPGGADAEGDAARVEPGPVRLDLAVLVAEDDEHSRFAVRRLLEKAGCTPTCAGNGREALDLLDRQAFDLVLMDVQMPVLDGVEATRAIRRREAAAGGHIPIVAMTAYAMRGDRERFLDAGMDDYIAKPMDLPDLLELMTRTMEARRAR